MSVGIEIWDPMLGLSLEEVLLEVYRAYCIVVKLRNRSMDPIVLVMTTVLTKDPASLYENPTLEEALK